MSCCWSRICLSTAPVAQGGYGPAAVGVTVTVKQGSTTLTGTTCASYAADPTNSCYMFDLSTTDTAKPYEVDFSVPGFPSETYLCQQLKCCSSRTYGSCAPAIGVFKCGYLCGFSCFGTMGPTPPSPTITNYTVTGSTCGAAGVESPPFSVQPNGVVTDTITISIAGTAGGITSVTTLTWAGTSDIKTFTYTPATTGTETITLTSANGFTVIGSPVTYPSVSLASGVQGATVTISDGSYTSPSLTTPYNGIVRVPMPGSGKGPWTITANYAGQTAVQKLGNIVTAPGGMLGAPPAVPTANNFTITGPVNGTVTCEPSTFTVTPNGAVTDTITISLAGTTAGSTSPTTLTWAASASPMTFTYTPAAVGTETITLTSAHAYSVIGSPISYAVTLPDATLSSSDVAGFGCVPFLLSCTNATFFFFTARVAGCSADPTTGLHPLGIAGAAVGITGMCSFEPPVPEYISGTASALGTDQTTDSNGLITGFLLPPGTYTWSVSFVPRFQTQTGTFKWNLNQNLINCSPDTISPILSPPQPIFVEVYLVGAPGYHCFCNTPCGGAVANPCGTCAIPARDTLTLVDSVIGAVTMTYQPCPELNVGLGIPSLWKGTIVHSFPDFCGCLASIVTLTYYWPYPYALNGNVFLGHCPISCYWHGSIVSMKVFPQSCSLFSTSCEDFVPGAQGWYCPTDQSCVNPIGVRFPPDAHLGCGLSLPPIECPTTTSFTCFPLDVVQAIPADAVTCNQQNIFGLKNCEGSDPWQNGAVSWSLTE